MDIVATKQDQALTLKTPQSVIHIKHHITLRQYKYWVLLLQSYRESYKQNIAPENRGLYRIPLSRLTDFLGYEPVKEELKTDFEALRKEPIIINLLSKDGKKSQRGMGFISEWEITSKTIYFRIPVFLEEVMKGLDSANDIFHLLNWQIFNHFNGKYEAIVYKLCKDYIGVCRTPYMTVFEFRDYIGLNESEYTEFKELNRWTISLPIKNINESPVSDIIVTAEFERKGRKVEGLYFTVKPKHQAALPPAEPESSLAFALAKVTITPQEQEDYLKLLSIEQIQHCIERANEYGEDLEKKGKKVHYRAVYKSAITENWGEQHQQIKVLTVKEEPKKDSVKPTPPDPAQNSLQQLPERFTQLSADEKHSVISLFISNQKGITKARMQAEYAGSKLAILDSSAFMTPFVLFLGKHWS